MRKYLVTSALPYANGPLHFGHLAGVYLPADIFCRHQRLAGNSVLHVCGTDEHGVAIIQGAKKANMPYQAYVNHWHQEFKTWFAAFGVQFDIFGQTSSPYHHQVSQDWFSEIHQKGYINPRQEEQLHCNSCNQDLADRFVEGTCYVCKNPGARGDECPECGEWIDSIKLIQPQCKMCGSSDISIVTVTQFYLELSKYFQQYRQWFDQKTDWRETVLTQLKGLTHEKLVDRAITRTLDWGVDLPQVIAESYPGKKMYVWFDAPIGYVSFTEEHLGKELAHSWWNDDQVTILNFLGKDNVIFHGLIFPCMSLMSEKCRPVSEVVGGQFLQLNGKQFSKSSGNYLDSQKMVQHFGPTALRYYLTTLLPEHNDANFTIEQFYAKVNNELSNNIGNLYSRVLKFIQKNWPQGIPLSQISTTLTALPLGETIFSLAMSCKKNLDHFEFRRALNDLMSIGAEINNYFTAQTPWAQIKVNTDEAAATCRVVAQGICVLSGYFAPFLPQMADTMQRDLKLNSEDIRLLYQANSIFDWTGVLNGKNFDLTGIEITPLVPKLEATPEFSQ